MRDPLRVIRAQRWLLAALLLSGCGGSSPLVPPPPPPPPSPPSPPPPPPPPGSADVRVDAAVVHQTMTGWEATAQAGQDDPGFAGWRNQLLDLAVSDLGINRLRLEVRAGTENTRDYWTEFRAGLIPSFRCERYLTVNDNSNPLVINPAGFKFAQLDSAVVKLVLPMRQRLQARGERLHLNLNYVAFIDQCGSGVAYFHNQPAEYAEFILATFLHLRDVYQIVPDAVEIILEPDNVSAWSGTLIGQAMVATAARLQAAGFNPEFIAPSTTSMANAVSWFDAMMQVSGAAGLIDELSYHRYSGVSAANLAALAQRATARGIRTAMLEHIGSDVEDLYEDLTVGRVSAWQQFTLAFPGPDEGGNYYNILNGVPVMASRTRALRQYFRYVRLGAVRIGATSTISQVRPVAFRNPNGGTVVVLHLAGARTVTIGGLPAGSYGASITTGALTGSELGDRVAGSDGILSVSAPAGGVLTVYPK